MLRFDEISPEFRDNFQRREKIMEICRILAAIKLLTRYFLKFPILKKLFINQLLSSRYDSNQLIKSFVSLYRNRSCLLASGSLPGADWASAKPRSARRASRAAASRSQPLAKLAKFRFFPAPRRWMQLAAAAGILGAERGAQRRGLGAGRGTV